MHCDVTYEELARLAAGEADEQQARALDQHVRRCTNCRTRLEALQKVDAALGSLARAEPTAEAVLRTLSLVRAETGQSAAREIMTLDEVADFLRLRPDDLAEIAEELPAFEVAGRIRVRRTRLLQWIEDREKHYLRARVESEVAQLVSRTPFEGADR